MCKRLGAKPAKEGSIKKAWNSISDIFLLLTLQRMIASFFDFIFTSPRRRFLWGVVVLAFAIRLALMLLLGDPAKPEMYEMGAIASNMLHGHGYGMHWLTYVPIEPVRKAMVEAHLPPPYEGAWQPPLQTYIVYYAFRLFGETPTAASMLMLLNVLWSTLIPLVVYRCTLLLGASIDAIEKPARLSALFATFFLPAAYAVVTYSGSSLYQLVFLLFFWMLVLALRLQNMKYLLAAGIFAGIQMLLRSEFLVLGMGMLLLTGLVAAWQLKNWRFLMSSVVGCVLALLVIMPWMVRNYTVFGKVVPIVSRPWFEIWRGNNPDATGAAWKKDGSWYCSVLTDSSNINLTREFDAIPYTNDFELRANEIMKREALAFMREHPEQALLLAGQKIVFLWIHDLYNPQSQKLPYIASMLFFSILIWCGAWTLWNVHGKQMKDGAILLYGAYILFYTGIFALTFILPRYRVYVFSGLLPLTGLGAFRLWQLFHYRFHRKQKT